MHRRIAGRGRGPGLHIGNALAVDRNRLVLRDHKSIRGECARRALQHDGSSDALDQHQRGRRHRILDVGEQIAVAFGFLGVEPPDIDDADLAAGPAACARSSHRPPASRPRTPAAIRREWRSPACRPAQKKSCTARRGPGLDRDRKLRSPARNRRQRHAEHGVGCVGPRSDRPRRARLHHEPVADGYPSRRRSEDRASIAAPLSSPSQMSAIEEIDLFDEPYPRRRAGAVDAAR